MARYKLNQVLYIRDSRQLYDSGFEDCSAFGIEIEEFKTYMHSTNDIFGVIRRDVLNNDDKVRIRIAVPSVTAGNKTVGIDASFNIEDIDRYTEFVKDGTLLLGVIRSREYNIFDVKDHQLVNDKIYYSEIPLHRIEGACDMDGNIIKYNIIQKADTISSSSTDDIYNNLLDQIYNMLQ